MSAVQLVPKTDRSLVLNLTVGGEPVPKARPRITRRGSFTPPRTASHEALVGMLARGRVQSPVAGDLILELDFYLGNKRRVDWDNLAKCLSDSLNEIVWLDDSQIVEATVRKFVDRDRPRSEIRVWKAVA